ncbi:hypothetical protein [Gimesia sp.]|uniref:hypothetical protein n=1 Tax=Gimesia sp. TaxID=2024833 RepID=UPI0032F04141
MLSGKEPVWVNRVIRRPERPTVEWFSLGTLGSSEITIGVLRDGTWVVDTADGLAHLDETRSLVFILPLLNSTIEELCERLERFINESGVHKTTVPHFPFDRLVVYAVSRGGYWAEQAFCWLADVDLDVDQTATVIHALLAIEENKTFTQQLRHKARRYRIQMERQIRG